MRIALELRTAPGKGGESLTFRTEVEIDGHAEAFREGAEFQAACFALCSGIEHAQAINAPIAEAECEPKSKPIPGAGTVGLDAV